jgi:PHD-finger
MAGGSRAPRMKRRAMPYAACIDSKPSPPSPPLPKAHPSTSGAVSAPKIKDDEPPPWDKMQKKEFEPVKVRWSGDRCAVCSSEIDYDTDQLIPCHSCGIVVHQSCYGVRELPREEDRWLCRACEAVHRGEPQPHCAVCPVQGGALKRCTIDGLWCHLACMQVLPGPCTVHITTIIILSMHIQPQSQLYPIIVLFLACSTMSCFLGIELHL